MHRHTAILKPVALLLAAGVVLAVGGRSLPASGSPLMERSSFAPASPHITAPIVRKSSEEFPIPSSPMQEELPSLITAIGDSVMLGASDQLSQLLPNCYVDAKESRQVWDGLDVVNQLEEQNQLGDTVVIALGTNGTFDQETGQALLDRLGEDRSIYWVTAYGSSLSWQSEVNTLIRTLVHTNEQVTLIDWAAIAPQHPEWFYSDGLHLTPEGRSGYAAFLAEQLSEPLPHPNAAL